MPTSQGVSGVLDAPEPKNRARLVAVAVAAVLLCVVFVARLAIDRAAPGMLPPFCLLYPAVLVAGLLGGWRAGLGILVFGGYFCWAWVMDHPLLRSGGAPVTGSDYASLALFLVSGAAIIAVTHAYRGAAARLRRHDAEHEMEERLDVATASAGMGVWEWRGQGPIIASVQAKALCGLAPEEPVTPEALLAMVVPEERDAARARLALALDPEVADLSAYEFRIVTQSGDSRWLAVSGQAVKDAAGGRRLVGAVIDITARKAAEAVLSSAADRLHQISEAGRLAVWRVDPALGLVHDKDLNAIYGLHEDTRLTPDDLRSFYVPGELDRLRTITSAAWARGQRYVEVEARIRRADGVERWVMLRGELGLNAEGQPRAAIGVTMDITDRKEAEAQLNLMAQEVNHRANNLLAVVQGAVQLSKAPTPDSLKEVVLGRIAALGRAHQLLSPERFEDAELGRLAAEELSAFTLGESGRVRMEGPSTPLPPAAAQAISLALHELATNAAKYGALSTAAGRVSVTWLCVPDGPLELVWAESGGPTVRKPTRLGQGTILLTQALAGPLGGSAELEWRKSGLVCILRLPAMALEGAGAAA